MWAGPGPVLPHLTSSSLGSSQSPLPPATGTPGPGGICREEEAVTEESHGFSSKTRSLRSSVRRSSPPSRGAPPTGNNQNTHKDPRPTNEEELWMPQEARSPEHSQAMPPVTPQGCPCSFCPMAALQKGRPSQSAPASLPSLAHVPSLPWFKDPPGSCLTFPGPSLRSSPSNFKASPCSSPGVGGGAGTCWASSQLPRSLKPQHH